MIHDGERYHRLAIKEGNTVENTKEHVECAQAIAIVLAAETTSRDERPTLCDFTEEDYHAILEYDAGLYQLLHERILDYGREQDCEDGEFLYHR